MNGAVESRYLEIVAYRNRNILANSISNLSQLLRISRQNSRRGLWHVQYAMIDRKVCMKSRIIGWQKQQVHLDM